MPSLSESDRQALLALARRAIETAVREDRLPGDIPQAGVFAERHGVFVTLRCRGRLRGCIGVVDPDEPLGESVVRSAVSAALADPRFPAVDAEEIQHLHIEISLLTTPHRISPAAIVIGRHGLLIRRDTRHGLLLPQVATEHGFNRQKFLEEVCRKASLPADAWKDPETQVCAFTCEVFAEAKKDPSGA